MSSSSRPVSSRRARPVFNGPTYTTPQYHSGWGRLIFFLFLFGFVLVIGLGGGMYWALHRAQSNSSQVLQFRVQSGDSITSVGDRLSHDHFLNNTLLFRLDARLQGLAGKLKVGNYILRRSMSIDGMVAALMLYRAATVRITIPEGKRSEEIAAILQAHGIDAKSFLAEVRHPDIRYLNASILASKPAGSSLEGYLYPNTYDVAPHSSGKAFASTMVQQLDTVITPAMRASLRAQHRTVYQALILASIVEREARVPDERPLIAGVYMNRIKSHGLLNADPTIQYALGKPGNWWPVLQAPPGTLATTSPYNTYLRAGLPPGPIANPGAASIIAAIYPRKTAFYYFVAIRGGHGRHVFATTLEQQTANIQKYG